MDLLRTDLSIQGVQTLVPGLETPAHFEGISRMSPELFSHSLQLFE